MKEILFSPGYKIDLKGNIESDLPIRIEDKYITLPVHGKDKRLPISWLSLIAHYEVNLPYKLLMEIHFVNVEGCRYAPKCKQQMFFRNKSMFNLNGGYRIIPGYTNYAINREGSIVEVSLDEIKHYGVYNKDFKNRLPCDKGEYTKIHVTSSTYLRCSLTDPDMGYVSSKLLHRLVALAWVKNKDIRENRLVNHKNGNKHDPSASNLEWCNYVDNINHAYRTGLRDENKDVRVKILSTGEVKEYYGLNECCRDLNLPPAAVSTFTTATPYGAYKGLYEFRFLDDYTEWVNTEPTEKNGNQQFNFVIKKSGKTLHGIRELVEHYKLKYEAGYRVDHYIKQLPKGEVEVVKTRGRSFKTQTYNVKTGEIKTHRTLKEAAKYSGVHYSAAKSNYSKGERYTTSGYAFRKYSVKKWDTNFKSNHKSKPNILATCKSTGEVLEFKSAREIERKLGLNQKAVRRSLDGFDINFKYTFKYE